MLFKAGCDIDLQDNEGATAMHVAAALGSRRIVKLLIDLGANAEIKDNQGRTPLDVAKELNRKPVVRIFEKPWKKRIDQRQKSQQKRQP
jgi:ankyrin repeat protein